MKKKSFWKPRKIVGGLVGPLVLLAVLPAPASAYPRPGRTELVSLRHDGSQPGSPGSTAWGPDITPDGRWVAFSFGQALTLEGADYGVYLRDRKTGDVELVSKSSTGAAGNFGSQTPRLSEDARYVAFESEATNLVPQATTGWNIYLRDRDTGETELISQSSTGVPGNRSSIWPSISTDGRYVAFASDASNLVPGDANPFRDVFVRDRQTGTTELISVSSDGGQGAGISEQPAISADGRYVAFASGAPNLVPADANDAIDVFVRDREEGTTEMISVGRGGAPSAGHTYNYYFYGSYLPSISADGNLVGFTSYATNLVPADTNASVDVFVRDRGAGTTERVSVSSTGAESHPRVRTSFAGCGCTYIPFSLNADAFWSVLSPDGRYVTFLSEAEDLVAGDSNNTLYDTFIHDRLTGETELVSLASDGSQPPTGTSTDRPAVTAGGRYVAFIHTSPTLGPPGTKPTYHVYIRDRGDQAGVGAVQATVEDTAVSVSGWASLHGAGISEADDPIDGNSVWRNLGAELTGASLIYRPEEEDLLLRMRIHDLKPATVPQAVNYGIRYYAGSQLHEITCHSGSCSGALGYTAGTIGDEIWVRLPAPPEGTVMDRIKVFTGQRNPATGLYGFLDEVDLPNATIPPARVSLGVAPAETPEDEVTFSTAATLAKGRFSGSLDASGLSGPLEVWARACLGEVCGTASTPVTWGVIP